MQNSCVQMSLSDTYSDVCAAMEENKSGFLRLLEEHINLRDLIPARFYWAFNRRLGRRRKYALESFLRFFILQKTLGVSDKTLLVFMGMSVELCDYCGFDKVPDASKITRFRQDFVEYIQMVFEKLVEITEPICRELDAKKADYLIYDTTGIEANVAENNPKFLNAKLTQAKKMAKRNPDLSPHALAYGFMPETSSTNPLVKQQYINGHFCYAFKAGILTNGLGIVRGISFFDEDFKRIHPETVSQKTDNPDLDKEIGDSISLKPVLTDFFEVHPSFSYKTFLGDSAFDSYDNYRVLRDKFEFQRMCIPLNLRNSSSTHSDFATDGTPLCPLDKSPFTFLGICHGKNRSKRFKWVCHNSIRVGAGRFCSCQTPCTSAPYGRCVYTYPDKNLRLYPGIPRGTTHWDNLYRHRVLIERTINILKNTLGVAGRKSFSSRTAKADLLFAGITHLIGVVLAKAINKPHLFKSVRKLLIA